MFLIHSELFEKIAMPLRGNCSWDLANLERVARDREASSRGSTAPQC
jgi:hypothetical protein